MLRAINTGAPGPYGGDYPRKKIGFGNKVP